jgi:hypothetical protein
MIKYYANATVNYPDAELDVPPSSCDTLHRLTEWFQHVVTLHEAQSFVITIVKSKDG